jgi:hypothetical protein
MKRPGTSQVFFIGKTLKRFIRYIKTLARENEGGAKDARFFCG